MRRIFPHRPTTVAYGLPGNSKTQSHAGKPSSKLTTLDPVVAQKELLSPAAHPAPKVHALVEKMNRTEATSPPAPRNPISRLAKALGRGFTKVTGLSPGKPKPKEKLLRYAGTSPQTQANTNAQVAEPRAAADPAQTLVQALGHEQAHLHAQIDVNEADGVSTLVDQHRDEAAQRLALLTRRATRLADRAHELTRQRTDMTAELAELRTAIPTATEALAATQALLTQTRSDIDEHHLAQQHDEARPSTSRPDHRLGTLLRSERRQELDEQAAQLQQAQDEQDSRLQAQRARLAQIETGLPRVEAQLAQALLSARVTAGDLFEQNEAVTALADLQPLLQPVRDHRAEALAATLATTQEARAGLQAGRQAYLEDQTEALLGFESAPHAEPLQHALRSWADGLEPATTAFGAQALSASDVLSIAVAALSAASRSDTAQAAQALAELQGLGLEALVPRPDAPADAAPPTLSHATRRTAELLANVPLGMQVLAHLTAKPQASPPAPLTKELLEPARLYLRAEALLHRQPPPDEADCQWLAGAQRAARRALHAPQPADGLAASSVAERAAYQALHNGYESQAPGSAYDRANQHLQKLADSLRDRTAPGGLGAPNPLSSLPQALAVGTATALPTPVRRAHALLAEATGHLTEYLIARRHQLPPGQVPSDAELALQALAEHVQRQAEYTSLTTLRLDAAALRNINARRQDLAQHFTRQAARQGRGAMATPPAAPCPAPPHAALDAAWRSLGTPASTLPQVLTLLQQRLLETPQPSAPGAAGSQADAHWAEREAGQLAKLLRTVAAANRLLHDGDPRRVNSGRALFDLCRDMLEHLEWRDKLRIVGQRVVGLNLTPVTASVAALLPTGIGARLIASAQHSEERLIEFYMGRTGLYMQIGEQALNQFQLGAGVSGGYAWKLHEEASIGLGVNADLRLKWEAGIEQGLQLRVPRVGAGRELELRAEFMDMFEHLMHLVTPPPHGQPACQDRMRELLAHHPGLNFGLIDNAPRHTQGIESNISGVAALRAGDVAGRARRANLSASLGLKSKKEASHTTTHVAGYMSTLYRDSTAQAKSELGVRLTAGAQAHQWLKGQDRQRAGLGTGGPDLSFVREVRAAGTTHFCTLFTFGDEIDPTRSDCATDFLSFKDFERDVRREWNAWVHYGTVKLPKDMGDAMRHVVAERQLEDFLDQARAFAKGNKYATMYADKVLKAEAAPMLDACRARARLWRAAGQEDRAHEEDLKFDRLIAEPALWEPTILILREKTKLQAERGLDFLLKLQSNRIAESMRTVGQWVLYEPVPQPTPERPRVEPARRWREAGLVPGAA